MIDFFPLIPIKPSDSATQEEEDLNGFGNLALHTVSGNSKFSNLSASGKITTYESIIKQS